MPPYIRPTLCRTNNCTLCCLIPYGYFFISYQCLAIAAHQWVLSPNWSVLFKVARSFMIEITLFSLCLITLFKTVWYLICIKWVKVKRNLTSTAVCTILGPKSRAEGAVFCSLIRELVGNKLFSFYDNMVIFVSFFSIPWLSITPCSHQLLVQ